MNLTRTLRRDWWLILLVVAVTVGGIVVVKGRMVDRYEATSIYGLQFPVRPPTPQDVVLNRQLRTLRVNNPMLNYDNRGTVTEIIVGRLTSDQSRSVMAKRGVPEYRTEIESTRVVGGGSLLFNTVAVGSTPEQALRGAAELKKQAQAVLRQLQQPAVSRPEYLITLIDVNAPVDAPKSLTDQVRLLAAIALLGFLVLLAVLSISAGWRAARRNAQRASASRPEPLGPDQASSGGPVPEDGELDGDRLEPDSQGSHQADRSRLSPGHLADADGAWRHDTSREALGVGRAQEPFS